MEKSYKYSYKVQENFLTSLSVYNVGYQKCEPEYQWGPGVRNHYCIHYVISGNGYYEVNNETYCLRAGDVFILYPNEEIRYYADTEHPWEYCWVGFMGTDASAILKLTDFKRKHPVITKGNFPQKTVQEQLNRIYEIKGNDHESTIAMIGALYTLLSTFIHCAEKKEYVKDQKQVYVEKAKDYIEKSYSYPLTVEDIAAYVGISRSHLFRAFQVHMGESPKEYLTEYRIRQACQLLKTTDLSISTIAYSVGFDNNLYFSKAFRHVKDKSPSQYRKEKRQIVSEQL